MAAGIVCGCACLCLVCCTVTAFMCVDLLCRHSQPFLQPLPSTDVSAGAALSSDVDSTQPLSPTTMGLDDWDPLRKHFLAQSNDYERSLAAESEKRVELCRHFNSRRGCSRGNRCIYLHVPRGPYSDVKTLESAAPNLRLYQALPPRHTWVAVEVITVVTPYSFYIHFPIGTTPLLEQQTAVTSGKWESSCCNRYRLWCFIDVGQCSTDPVVMVTGV